MYNDNEFRRLPGSLESQKEKEDKLTIMEERFNSMQSQMQSMISALGSMEQSNKNTFAKQLFENGIYKNEPPRSG